MKIGGERVVCEAEGETMHVVLGLGFVEEGRETLCTTYEKE